VVLATTVLLATTAPHGNTDNRVRNLAMKDPAILLGTNPLAARVRLLVSRRPTAVDMVVDLQLVSRRPTVAGTAVDLQSVSLPHLEAILAAAADIPAADRQCVPLHPVVDTPEVDRQCVRLPAAVDIPAVAEVIPVEVDTRVEVAAVVGQLAHPDEVEEVLPIQDATNR